MCWAYETDWGFCWCTAHPAAYQTVSLPELMEVVSDLVLRTPMLLMLGDLNIHAKAALTGAAQDFMAAMTIMGCLNVSLARHMRRAIPWTWFSQWDWKMVVWMWRGWL